MKKLNLIQGSEEWLEARLNYLCASEAPVMMGDSQFMARSKLLDIKKGWQLNPINDFKKRLFSKGHEYEDSARELLEFDICEDLPAVVGMTVIDGLELLASFDGYADSGAIWEHKSWNEVLSENVRNGVLEPMYYWQLEHQMLVAGIDEANFTVSDGTADKRVNMNYRSIPDRRAALIAGWTQFVVDLEAHDLKAKPERVVARVQTSLPVIECRVEGSVVVSNLGDYIPLIQNLADEQMALILETDQDFSDKDAFNKNVKHSRASLKIKAEEIETAFESLAEFNVFVGQADLILQKLQSHGEKQVADAKTAKRLAIISGAKGCIENHLHDLAGTINGVRFGMNTDWQEIIKGKRSFEKMQEAVDSEIAKLKISANDTAAIIRKNLDSLTALAGEHKFLFADHAELIQKDNEDLVNLIKMRIAEHEEAEAKRLENERIRIRAEEEAKAKREAEAKADTVLEAERESIRKEEREKAQAIAQKPVEEVVQSVVGDTVITDKAIHVNTESMRKTNFDVMDSKSDLAFEQREPTEMILIEVPKSMRDTLIKDFFTRGDTVIVQEPRMVRVDSYIVIK